MTGSRKATSLWPPCRRIGVLFLVTTVSFAARSALASEFTSEAMATLAIGKAVAEVEEAPAPADGQILAAIDIPASPDRVWTVLLDCAGATSFMPSLRSCLILERGPGLTWDVREHRVQWTSFLPEMRSVFRSHYKQNVSIKFSRVEGDLAFLDGEWRLQPLPGGGGTRLIYDTRVGFHALVPGFMVRSALLDDIPKFLVTLRDEILRRN